MDKILRDIQLNCSHLDRQDNDAYALLSDGKTLICTVCSHRKDYKGEEQRQKDYENNLKYGKQRRDKDEAWQMLTADIIKNRMGEF